LWFSCEDSAVRRSTQDVKSSTSAYGHLLDVSDVSLDVDLTVHRWAVRGAISAMLYAFGLAGVAFTIAAHNSPGLIGYRKLSYGWDCGFSFFAGFCKLMVGFCIHKVHRHLSQTSRTIAGDWVCCLAWSKYLASGTHFMLSLLFLLRALGLLENAFMCLLMYVFLVSVLLVLVFQSSAALCLLRIHHHAAAYVGDAHVFSDIVGCWWTGLVVGTFGVGAGTWLAGTMAVFDDIADDSKPFELSGHFELFAALSQILAGCSMMIIDRRVRGYFASCRDKEAAQADDARNAISAGVVEMIESPRARPALMGRSTSAMTSADAL